MKVPRKLAHKKGNLTSPFTNIISWGSLGIEAREVKGKVKS